MDINKLIIEARQFLLVSDIDTMRIERFIRINNTGTRVLIEIYKNEIGEPIKTQIDIENLAKMLHEAGREAVEKKKTVVASLGMKTPNKFLEWDEIAEDAKEGRRIQARYLKDKLSI